MSYIVHIVRMMWAFILLFPATASPVFAQNAAPDKCLALAQMPQRQLIQKAGFRPAALKTFELSLRYLGHSTFLLKSPKGVTIATDYNDYITVQPAPTIATMNLAHDSHHSYNPDPAIKHLLRGWNSIPGNAQIHDISEQDVRVRNVPTNLRSYGNGVLKYGNSIFVFEVSGLCVAHLGHLHHTLTVQQLAQIGQMDVVLIPVDGSWTLDVTGMMSVLKSLRASLVIPMHYFSEETLGRFITAAQTVFPIKRLQSSELIIARDRLPAKTQIWILPPG